MVRSRERTRPRRAHRFGCQKHEISGSRWTSAISVLRLHVEEILRLGLSLQSQTALVLRIAGVSLLSGSASSPDIVMAIDAIIGGYSQEYSKGLMLHALPTRGKRRAGHRYEV
jgi:hypothetical protein